jgi:putrescine transport system permease protein
MKRWIEKHFGKAWMLLVYLFLYTPLLFMVVFSFNSTRQDANFTGFSLRWYEALTRDTKIVEGFWLSLQVAAITGVLSAVMGTFAAFVLVRYRRFLGRTVFSGMVNAPLVMPEVVIGLSLLLLMVGAQNLLGWPERGMLTIILGHTLLGMAYGMVVVQSRLLEVNRSFTLSFDDVVISEFLSGPGVSTLPQVIFGYARRGINPTIYAAATLLIVTVTIVIISYSVWVARQTRKREREIAAAARMESVATR